MEKTNLQDRMPAPRTKLFLDGEGASVKGFLDFCKRNTPLVIAVTLAALFVYGAILFNFALSNGTIFWLSDQNLKTNIPGFAELGFHSVRIDDLSIGRWAAVLFSDLFFIKETGIYAANFIGIVSVWLFSLLFCYFIAVFTKNTQRHNGFIPLALVLLTYAVWPLYFLNIYGNKIQPTFIAIELISVYLLYDGLLSRNKIKILISFILTVFSFSVYQSFMLLFPCLVFIFFVLLQENSNLSPKEYSFLCLRLLVFFLAAFILNMVIARIVQASAGILKLNNKYVSGAMIWNKPNIKSILANILGLGYLVTIGLIPFVHSLFAPIMETMYGGSAAP
jgi:hypothetical protein